VTPILLIAVGLALFAVGSLVLRSLGARYRVGRLLAATPVVSVAEALVMADGPARYVAIEGRIDADDEFEDEAHRPLVLRRARLQRRRGRRWETADEHVQAVAFGIREGLDSIAIDHAALDDGLVVVPRTSVGTAADVPDRVREGTPLDTPVRLLVDLVSSVEHAIVLGVPRQSPAGASPEISAGLGRPLILSTLDRPEAMRILAIGGERRPLIAAVAFASGAIVLTVGIAWAIVGAATGTASAASPAPTAALGGDPRSSGSGPGLVGDPLFAIGAVVALGVIATVLTLVYVRLTAERRR
jgi:hypothetical protein